MVLNEATGELEPLGIEVTIVEVPHPRFVREGDDLGVQVDVPLVDSLTGFTMTVKRLNNTFLKKSMERIVNPGDTLVLENEGMPRKRRPGERGSLIVDLNVKFPVNPLSDSQKQELKSALDPTATPPRNTAFFSSFAMPVSNAYNKTKEFFQKPPNEEGKGSKL